MMRQWTLTDLAEAEIEKLKADGITPTPQQILDIQALSLEAENDIVNAPTLSRGVPYQLTDTITLHPITLAGTFFFDDFCRNFDNPLLQNFGYIFTLAFGYDPAKMELRGEAARDAVKAMASKLTCSLDDLKKAIEFYSDDRPTIRLRKSDESEDNLASLSSMVVMHTGLDPAVVEYQMSLDYITQLVDAYINSLGTASNSSGLTGLKKLAVYVDQVRRANKDE